MSSKTFGSPKLNRRSQIYSNASPALIVHTDPWIPWLLISCLALRQKSPRQEMNEQSRISGERLSLGKWLCRNCSACEYRHDSRRSWNSERWGLRPNLALFFAESYGSLKDFMAMALGARPVVSMVKTDCGARVRISAVRTTATSPEPESTTKSKKPELERVRAEGPSPTWMEGLIRWPSSMEYAVTHWELKLAT